MPDALMQLNKPRLVFVTGPAGAGRTTAIKVLEDLGFETIDNLPLGMVTRLLDGGPLERPLALGLDTRNRDFSRQAYVDLLEQVSDYAPELLFLDCSRSVLQRRFSETRRRHPLKANEGVMDGIDKEFAMLAPLRDRADILIDTTELSVHGLRDALDGFFASRQGRVLAVSVTSFSYKRGLPTGMDLVFDCRFLRNPYWEPALRDMTGMDDPVGAYVQDDERFADFLQKLQEMLEFLLPAYAAEGKAHLGIGLGCTGGQHRSVFVTEKLAQALADLGWQVSIRHRELDRHNGRKVSGSKQAGSGVAKA